MTFESWLDQMLAAVSLLLLVIISRGVQRLPVTFRCRGHY